MQHSPTMASSAASTSTLPKGPQNIRLGNSFLSFLRARSEHSSSSSLTHGVSEGRDVTPSLIQQCEKRNGQYIGLRYNFANAEVSTAREPGYLTTSTTGTASVTQLSLLLPPNAQYKGTSKNVVGCTKSLETVLVWNERDKVYDMELLSADWQVRYERDTVSADWKQAMEAVEQQRSLAKKRKRAVPRESLCRGSVANAAQSLAKVTVGGKKISSKLGGTQELEIEGNANKKRAILEIGEGEGLKPARKKLKTTPKLGRKGIEVEQFGGGPLNHTPTPSTSPSASFVSSGMSTVASNSSSTTSLALPSSSSLGSTSGSPPVIKSDLAAATLPSRSSGNSNTILASKNTEDGMKKRQLPTPIATPENQNMTIEEKSTENERENEEKGNQGAEEEEEDLEEYFARYAREQAAAAVEGEGREVEDEDEEASSDDDVDMEEVVVEPQNMAVWGEDVANVKGKEKFEETKMIEEDGDSDDDVDFEEVIPENECDQSSEVTFTPSTTSTAPPNFPHSNSAPVTTLSTPSIQKLNLSPPPVSKTTSQQTSKKKRGMQSKAPSPISIPERTKNKNKGKGKGFSEDEFAKFCEELDDVTLTPQTPSFPSTSSNLSKSQSTNISKVITPTVVSKPSVVPAITLSSTPPLRPSSTPLPVPVPGTSGLKNGLPPPRFAPGNVSLRDYLARQNGPSEEIQNLMKSGKSKKK